ncbi:retrovirus-related pol polyprotein from transposon TNT 1-94 [Tanacetum coccineum]
MSTQQDIYVASSENHPPILNKDNYVLWSSRLLRYAKSKPNGKLICNSIINGPYVKRMIPKPGDPYREVPTILMGLPEDIYAAVDSCETAQEIWFTSTDGELIESYYHRFSKLMNNFKRNKHFPEKISSNLKFLNNLQPEWSRHVTIVHQTKDLHEVDYTQLYDFLKYNQVEVNELRAERLARIHDPLALMANSNNLYNYPVFHQDQPSQADCTAGYNAIQNVGNQVVQNAVQNLGIQNVRNQNGIIVVSGIANQNLNQNGNDNVVATQAEGNGNGNGNNGNQGDHDELRSQCKLHLMANLQQHLTPEADESPAKHKALELEIERLLRAVVSHNIMSIVQSNFVVDTSNLQTEPERTQERFENCIIKKENEHAKVWNDCHDWEIKVKSKDAPCVSDTLDPLSQKLENENVELELDNTAKTRRPQPGSNTKNDRVPSACKSSCIKNKEVEVEEHPRNLLLSKNKKHMSSECNNIKLVIRNDISEVVCAMCKQCSITANHDVCVLKYVNDMNYYGDKHNANVSKIANQKKHKPNVAKPKKVGSKERLGLPKPSKPRSYLRWSPTGRIFDLKGKIIASSELECQSDGSNGDNACLGHNLFSVGQFCDSDLEVAFRRNTCFVRNLKEVDLLKGNCTTNLYTTNLHEMAFAARIFLMARATSTKSWLWHQRLSHLNFDTINDLAKNDLVTGLPKFKYHKEHVCPSCEQGKSKKASHPPEPVPNSKQRLHLLHMDLCGPMKVESINGKRYVLVIVDDYSRYTWVHCLRTKDEVPEEIKTFLKKITVLLQAPVIIVRTDNGSKFKNQVLKEYFDSVGISHQASFVRTPQQHGVVERINYTLVEAARTMLIFSCAPLFLWAEAIATAALCYPKNDRKDIGKLGAKGDIGFFIGYSTTSCAYRVYNRRTRKIMETINVTFDELSAMAFEQRSSKPGLQSMTSGQITMYDDYIDGQPSAAIGSAWLLKYLKFFILQWNLHQQQTPYRHQQIHLHKLQIFQTLHRMLTSSKHNNNMFSNKIINLHSNLKPLLIKFRMLCSMGIQGIVKRKEYILENPSLRGTVNMGLWYTKDSGFELTGFSDADYVGCRDFFKSTSGGTQFLGKKLVDWSSKKQDCTALSTAKAEYMSLSA